MLIFLAANYAGLRHPRTTTTDRYMSLKSKTALPILALVLLPALIAGSLIYQNARDTIIANQLAALEAIADTKVKSIEAFATHSLQDFEHLRSAHFLATCLANTVTLAQQPQHPDYLASIYNLEKQVSTLRKDFGLKSIALMDSTGTLVYKSEPSPEQSLSRKQYSNFVADLLKRKGPLAPYVNFFHTPKDHTSGIVVVGPIRDGSIEAGVMVLEIEWAMVDTIFHDNTGLGQTGKSVLGKWVGEKHFAHLTSSLRVKPHLDKTMVKFGPADKPLPMQRAVCGENGSGLMRNFLGTRTFAAWRYLPEFDLGLVAKINADEALESIAVLKTTTTNILLITIIIGTVLALAFASLFVFDRRQRPVANGEKGVSSGDGDGAEGN